MNIHEIITNPPRDEYIDNYQPLFADVPTIARIRELQLKKVITPPDIIEYGLFNGDKLVGYMALELYTDDIWMVTLVQLAQAFKGQGYGTFLYDYAVMNDKLKVLSDATNTGGPHGSRNLWISLFNKKRYEVVGFDTSTNTVLSQIHPDEIYSDTPHLRWLALPGDKTINESLQYIQSHMKKRSVVWYGPGTSSPEYFNY